jgi:hypothetical protein
VPYRTPADPREQRRLPLLDRIAVKTSCRASWDEMLGDDTVRFCCTCSKNVYDLTAMPAEEAEEFLAQHVAAGGPLPCARIYRRPDGRVLTSECPTGAGRRHLRRFAKVFAAGAASAALLGGGVDLATRPVLGPDVEEPEAEAFTWQSARARTMGAVMIVGELEDRTVDRYDVNAALRSDEPMTSEVEGEGPARRRYVGRDPDDEIIPATTTLVSSRL